MIGFTSQVLPSIILPTIKIPQKMRQSFLKNPNVDYKIIPKKVFWRLTYIVTYALIVLDIEAAVIFPPDFHTTSLVHD